MGVKLRERPDKGWYVLTDYRGQRKAKCFGKDKKQAKLFADKLTARIKWTEQSGETIPLSRPDQAMPTVGTYLTEWLEWTAKIQCKESTYEEYASAIHRRLLPSFGERSLSSVTRADLMKFAASMVEQGKARATIRNALAPLKAAYSQAVADGLVPVNPGLRINRLFGNNGVEQRLQVNPFTHEEANAVLKTVQDRYPILYPLLLCAVRAGLRQGELIGLQWGDVSFPGRFLEVRRAVVRRRETTTKNHKIRRVDLSPRLLETLHALKETRELEAMAKGQDLDPSEWVFLSPHGCRWDDAHLKRAWKRCLMASGLRQIRFHDLRHTYASHLIDRDAHAKYVQEQLGHGSISMTMDIYGHLFPNRNRGWVDKLDEEDSKEKSATPPQPESVSAEEERLSA